MDFISFSDADTSRMPTSRLAALCHRSTLPANAATAHRPWRRDEQRHADETGDAPAVHYAADIGITITTAWSMGFG